MALPDVVVELTCSILHPSLPSAVGLNLHVDPGGRHQLGAQLHRLAPGSTPRALTPLAAPVLSLYQAAPAPPRHMNSSWSLLHHCTTTTTYTRRLGDGQGPLTTDWSLLRKGGCTSSQSRPPRSRSSSSLLPPPACPPGSWYISSCCCWYGRVADV